jgi:hypothetical protein
MKVCAKKLYKLQFSTTGYAVPVVCFKDQRKDYFMEVDMYYLSLDKNLQCKSKAACENTLKLFRSYFSPMNPFNWRKSYPLEILQIASLSNYQEHDRYSLEMLEMPTWIKYLTGQGYHTSDVPDQYDITKYTQDPIGGASPYETRYHKAQWLAHHTVPDDAALAGKPSDMYSLESLGLNSPEKQRERRRNMMETYRNHMQSQMPTMMPGMGGGMGLHEGMFMYGNRRPSGRRSTRRNPLPMPPSKRRSGFGSTANRNKLLRLRKLINERKNRNY